MTIQIHNWYSDLLLSIRALFDNVIFPSNLIQSYSFNIANRTFELSKKDYRTGYSLPACIVNLLDDVPSFGERPTNIQRRPIENINMIPVLVTPDTGTTIYVQEEHVKISFNIKINCESQFQAKEMNFHIKRYLPENKYISIFEFTSFIHIPTSVLIPLGFNYHQVEIPNLFIRLNKNLGEPEHCFSLRYCPLINLESTSVDISDSSQRTFGISINLSYQIQMPRWLCYEQSGPTIEQINMDFTRLAYEPVTTNSMRSIINKTYPDPYGNTKGVIRRNIIISDLQELNLSKLYGDPDGKTYMISLRLNPNILKFNQEYKFNIFDIHNKIHMDVKPVLIDTSINEVRFALSDDEYSIYNASLVKPILLQIVQFFSENPHIDPEDTLT